MSEIFDTKTLENHVLSVYTRAVPVMNASKHFFSQKYVQ